MNTPKEILQHKVLNFSKFETGRIKCTCFDVTSQFILFGASVGSVYVYLRDTLSFRTLAANVVTGSIKILRVSLDGSLVALATESPHGVAVLEHNLRDGNKIAKWRVVYKFDPIDSVTALTWSSLNSTHHTLYASNEKGLVFKSLINSSASFLGTMKPPECIWDCKSPVVQLDCDQDGTQLAISSRVNTVVINFSKSSVKIIGKQERNGLFGAVFASSQPDILYAARPMRRLWKAEVSTGKVLKTIKYHDEIVAKITPFFSIDSKGDVVDEFLSRKGKEVEAKSLNIAKLVNFGNNVFSWSEDAVFFFDTEREEIIECHVDVVSIKDVAVLDNMLYVLHGYDQVGVSQIQFLPGGELLRMSTALNTDENVQKAIKFIKDYSVNDIPALEAVIEIISQSSLESEESAVQTIRSYLESLQAATLLQQQPTPIIITNNNAALTPTQPAQDLPSSPRSPSNETAAPVSPTPSNSIGFTRSVSTPLKPTPPSSSSHENGDRSNNSDNNTTTTAPTNPHLSSLAAVEAERRAVSLDAGRDALSMGGSPRDVRNSLSSPQLASSALQSSVDSDGDVSSPSPFSSASQSDLDDRAATASAVVSIPVTKIKGKRKKVSKREGVIIDSFNSSEGIKGRTSSPRQIFELETKPAEKSQWTEKLQKQQQAERQQQQAAQSTFGATSNPHRTLAESGGGGQERATSWDRGGTASPSSSSTEEHSQSPSSRFSALEEIGERGRKEVANLFSQSPPVKPEPSSLDFENVAVKTYTGTFKSTKALTPKPAEAQTGGANNAHSNDYFSFMIASATDIVKKSASELASTANSAVTELVRNADELHSTLQRNPSIQLVSSSTQALTNALSQSMQNLAAPLTGMAAESSQQRDSSGPNAGPFFFPAAENVSEPVSAENPTTIASIPSTPVTTPIEAMLFEPTPLSNPSPTAIAPTNPSTEATKPKPELTGSSEKPSLSESSPPLIGAQQSPVIVTRTRVSTPKRTPKLYQMQSQINGEVDEQELLQAEMMNQQKQQAMGGPITISTHAPSQSFINNNSPTPSAQQVQASPVFVFGSPSLSTASTPNADSPATSVTETPPTEKSAEPATSEKTSEPEVTVEGADEVVTGKAKIEETHDNANGELQLAEKDAISSETEENASEQFVDRIGTPEPKDDEATANDSSAPIEVSSPVSPAESNDDTPETMNDTQSDSGESLPSAIEATENGHGSSQQTPSENVAETQPESEVDLLTALMNRRLKKLAFCNDLVLLMTETTGSLCTINFLLEFYEMNESSKEVISSIPPSIFLKIMANGRSQITRKKTVHSTLQTIDNYLWSPRPATLAPQIQAVEILEQKGEKLLEQLIELRSSAAHRGQPLPSFLEDSHVHWGVRLNLNKKCSDTGFAVHYSQGSNLVVQRDGSLYHSLFVPEDACSDTLIENFSSLLDS